MEGLLIFIALIVLGNIFDKKKPKAQRLPDTPSPAEEKKPVPSRPKNNIKITMPSKARAEKKKALDDAFAQKTDNPYQKYAEAHPEQTEPYAPECEQPYDTSHKTHPHYDRGNGLPAGDKVTLAQAIVFGEILGKPKARQARRRFIR